MRYSIKYGKKPLFTIRNLKRSFLLPVGGALSKNDWEFLSGYISGIEKSGLCDMNSFGDIWLDLILLIDTNVLMLNLPNQMCLDLDKYLPQ